MHVVRLGDVAFATCPFELYLAYGQSIKARSAAKQTFLIGKCGSSGYVPTERSEKAVGYSGGVNVGRIGHQGGYMFCDEVVKGVAELFHGLAPCGHTVAECAVTPQASPRPSFDERLAAKTGGPFLIAHRGCQSLAPENTVAAFVVWPLGNE